MPVIEINDNPLFYFEYRVSGTAFPPIIFIHGAGGQHASWPPHVRRINGVRTFAPDLPGHGKSGGQGHSTIAGYTSDIMALANSLELDRFIAAGHSMGGGIALQLAVDTPSRVAGLILISTGAKLRVAPQVLDNIRQDFDRVIDMVTDNVFGPEADAALKRLGKRLFKATAPSVLHGDYLACDTFDIREKLHQVAAPALVIGGTADMMTPFKFAQYLADNLPRATLYKVKNAGHMLPAEQPEVTANIIEEWLGLQDWQYS